MNCWHCKRTAVATCRFCGRAVCEDHVQTRPYILQLHKPAAVTRALVVEDAIWCGDCTPKPNPIDLPELDQM